MEARKSNQNKLIDNDFEYNIDPYFSKKQSALVKIKLKLEFIRKNFIWSSYRRFVRIWSIFHLHE